VKKYFFDFFLFFQPLLAPISAQTELTLFSKKYVFARLREGKCKPKRISSHAHSKRAGFMRVSRQAFYALILCKLHTVKGSTKDGCLTHPTNRLYTTPSGL
jgi:hypothetical protein